MANVRRKGRFVRSCPPGRMPLKELLMLRAKHSHKSAKKARCGRRAVVGFIILLCRFFQASRCRGSSCRHGEQRRAPHQPPSGSLDADVPLRCTSCTRSRCRNGSSCVRVQANRHSGRTLLPSGIYRAFSLFSLVSAPPLAGPLVVSVHPTSMNLVAGFVRKASSTFSQ